jgi:hypothetical protein
LGEDRTQRGHRESGMMDPQWTSELELRQLKRPAD